MEKKRRAVLVGDRATGRGRDRRARARGRGARDGVRPAGRGPRRAGGGATTLKAETLTYKNPEAVDA